jgi:hypothetical protein
MMTSQRILRPLFVLLAASLWTAGAAGLRAADPSASPVSFTNDVMAVLGKAGCNSGPCHGHNSGKGGFKLSLRGGDPMRDYEELVHGALGRRVDKLVPESSLVLGKPSGRLRHGGGKRFEPDSEFYELVHRWITEGAHPDIDTATKLVRIEVTPESLVLEPG